MGIPDVTRPSDSPTDLAAAKEQEQQLRLALASEEQARGPQHPSLCATLVRLGVVIAKQGRAGEAEPFLERALKISEGAPGPINAATAQILIVLAQVQAVLRKPEATATARRALEALDATLGASHPTTRNARPILARIGRVRSPSYTRETLAEELEQGVAALRAHDPEGSIDLLIPVADRARDANAPAVESYARGMLAQALFLSGRKAEALSEAESALKIAQESGHKDAAGHFQSLVTHMKSADASPASVKMADYNKRIRDALELAHRGDPQAAFRQLADIARAAQAGGDAGPEASARIVLGQIHIARKEHPQAQAELERALAIARSVNDQAIIGHVTKLLDEID